MYRYINANTLPSFLPHTSATFSPLINVSLLLWHQLLSAYAWPHCRPSDCCLLSFKRLLVVFSVTVHTIYIHMYILFHTSFFCVFFVVNFTFFHTKNSPHVEMSCQLSAVSCQAHQHDTHISHKLLCVCKLSPTAWVAAAKQNSQLSA